MTQEATLLKGAEIAKKIQQELVRQLEEIKARYHETPKMVALQVGQEAASELYVKKQGDLARQLGMSHELVVMDANSKESEVLARIEELNRASAVHGIIIQMPLPKHLNMAAVLAALHPRKDIEGVLVESLGELVRGKPKLAPSTAIAAVELIRATGIDLNGKEGVVVGRSQVVGRPVSLLLLDDNVTVTVCHSGTSKRGFLESHVRRAEVLVVAIGRPNFIPGSWVREGAIVIDVGINRVDGKTVGDVEFEEAKKRAAFITPVPGGVGPLTVTMLMRNLLNAYLWQKEK